MFVCIRTCSQTVCTDIPAPTYNSVLPWNDSFICVRLIESLPRSPDSLSASFLSSFSFLPFISLPPRRFPPCPCLCISFSLRSLRSLSFDPFPKFFSHFDSTYLSSLLPFLLLPPSSTPTRLAVSISPRLTKLKGVPIIRRVLSLRFYFSSFVHAFLSSVRAIIARFQPFQIVHATSVSVCHGYIVYSL